MRTPEGTIAVAPATTGSRPRVGENGVLVVVVGTGPDVRVVGEAV